MQNLDLAIVIPCYNEANRLPLSQYDTFLIQHQEISICFVNDGSKDHTESVLKDFKSKFPKQIDLLSLPENKGKANAVFQGMNHFLKKGTFNRIAYLDADLATSLEECLRLSQFVGENVVLAFGSRILKLDNNIKRKWYRFLLGRMVATAISQTLKLNIYDSQCGCKIFEAQTASKVFDQPFISKWLFDVEIFFRIIGLYGREKIAERLREIPLNTWIDTPDSRVSPWYFFKLWGDLYKISKKYNH